MSVNTENTIEPVAATWRFKLGIALVCLAIGMWLCVPLAAWAGVPSTRIAAITGVIFIVNKILLLLVIAVMGKSGFQQLKGKIFGVFKLAPDTSVGSARYKLGLVMFCLPLITSWLEPYIDAVAPGLRPNIWQLQLLGDVMFLASFFVLGGNFWEKIRSLFIRTSRVIYTPTAE
ncbi:transporter suffix domain-containing protein [Rhizobium sp. 32-5/1]|uniref:transporter suffix domain-containing protein n=1 Tax=Rhizobium sp. 32-5/1 TaxID=3019602 RepID=UPI00240D40E3|nr:transporter suffix domain-containing protein [Rhizobium sp. 32-5/1]WEZ84655.1 transporter suffix domain-containing protein [Rhizobium sp. 32-5/1]